MIYTVLWLLSDYLSLETDSVLKATDKRAGSVIQSTDQRIRICIKMSRIWKLAVEVLHFLHKTVIVKGTIESPLLQNLEGVVGGLSQHWFPPLGT
jgi:hypothetical protein